MLELSGHVPPCLLFQPCVCTPHAPTAHPHCPHHCTPPLNSTHTPLHTLTAHPHHTPSVHTSTTDSPHTLTAHHTPRLHILTTHPHCTPHHTLHTLTAHPTTYRHRTPSLHTTHPHCIPQLHTLTTHSHYTPSLHTRHPHLTRSTWTCQVGVCTGLSAYLGSAAPQPRGCSRVVLGVTGHITPAIQWTFRPCHTLANNHSHVWVILLSDHALPDHPRRPLRHLQGRLLRWM